MKRLFSVFLAVLLLLTLVLPASAAGSVTYQANARKFILEPGSRYSPTDLFENFKNVMPGDTLTDQILIQNDRANKVKIKLYMRSLGTQEGSEDLLSQMNLTVQQKGSSVLFDAPADQTAQLTNWKYLGTIYSGGKITLDLTLEVPITMGNEFQNRIGYIDWEFKVEELPVEDSDPKPPKTGDNIAAYVAVMVLSLAVLIILLFSRKHKKKE